MSNVSRAAVWFGTLWLLACVAVWVATGFCGDEDAGFDGFFPSLGGVVLLAFVAAVGVFPIALLTFFWFGGYRRATKA